MRGGVDVAGATEVIAATDVAVTVAVVGVVMIGPAVGATVVPTGGVGGTVEVVDAGGTVVVG